MPQNLEGVACQMAASESILADDPSRAAAILSTAIKMLGSCRSELRRCLFDLRSDAIADQDFGNALRKTLEPVAADAALSIRFDISRAEPDAETVTPGRRQDRSRREANVLW